MPLFGEAANVVLSVHAAADVQVSSLNLVNGAVLNTANMQMGAGAAMGGMMGSMMGGNMQQGHVT